MIKKIKGAYLKTKRVGSRITIVSVEHRQGESSERIRVQRPDNAPYPKP